MMSPTAYHTAVECEVEGWGYLCEIRFAQVMSLVAVNLNLTIRYSLLKLTRTRLLIVHSTRPRGTRPSADETHHMCCLSGSVSCHETRREIHFACVYLFFLWYIRLYCILLNDVIYCSVLEMRAKVGVRECAQNTRTTRSSRASCGSTWRQRSWCAGAGSRAASSSSRCAPTSTLSSTTNCTHTHMMIYHK